MNSIIFSLGLLVLFPFLLPFSKKARKVFVVGLAMLLIYGLGWVVFFTGFAALYCWTDPSCAYLN